MLHKTRVAIKKKSLRRVLVCVHLIKQMVHGLSVTF